MNTPTRGDGTRETQIHILWEPLSTLAEMGGSAVASYWLEWDAGTLADSGASEAWYSLAGEVSNYPETSFFKTSGVLAGGEYAFRVSAINAHGPGPASDVKVCMQIDSHFVGL